MADLKLFKIDSREVIELDGRSLALEKSLQNILEENLETFIGVRFLASEYITGKSHGGRIDTLGIDENNFPVIIEYKRSMNENVINQGLYYLDWLMDHKAEFELMVMNKFGLEVSSNIDWSGPRLICIAGGFTKFDEHAVQQINRNIELYNYKYYDGNLLLLELVNATTSQNNNQYLPSSTSKGKNLNSSTITNTIEKADSSMQDLYNLIDTYIVSLGDDVQVKKLKKYIAFKRIKNFTCLQLHPQSQKIVLFLKVDPSTINLEPDFSRDVRNIGHYGTGDLEVTIRSENDFAKAKVYIDKAYEVS